MTGLCLAILPHDSSKVGNICLLCLQLPLTESPSIRVVHFCAVSILATFSTKSDLLHCNVQL